MFNDFTKLLVILLISFCCTVQCASILALFSSLSYADHLVFRGYVSKLVQKGHSVVMMTPYPGHFDPQLERIIELDVGTESGQFWEQWRYLMIDTDDYYNKLGEINELSLKIAIAQLRSKQMTALLINPNIKFDLVITEADVPVLYAAAEKYKAPHIAITVTSGKIHQHEAKANPIHPILYPDVNSLNYRNLTQWQKLVEFNRHVQTKQEYYNNYIPLSELAARKIFGLQRDLVEVEYDIDLLFITANPLLCGSRPTTPATIFTDRLHINPGAPLPEDLKTILDASVKGVVYFSIGAVHESEQLSSHVLKILAESFREVPFKVLWKIGNTTMITIGENVVTRPWFPQQEILAHPNVKAFITHGGPRSLEEALFYGVPIIGLPTVKSRKVFIQEITRHGGGEILDIHNLEKATLVQTISQVANNQNYKDAIASLKSKVVDPIISGPDIAIWWTEYVLQNGGAKNYRSPAVGLTFIKYYMIDILLTVLFVAMISLVVLVIVVRRIVKRIYAKICKKQSVTPEGKFKAL